MIVQAELVGQLVRGALLVWMSCPSDMRKGQSCTRRRYILVIKLHPLLIGTAASFPEAGLYFVS